MSSTTSTTTTQPPIRPRIGVGVFILHPNTTPFSPASPNPNPTFLLGQRLGSHGAGTWALPGGHLEMNESFETCAAREIAEETGLSVTNIRFLTATNDVMAAEGKHYVTVFVTAEVADADRGVEPQVLEPEKCAEWKWVDWEEMLGMVEREEEVFLPLVNLVRDRPGVVPGLV